jgi:hypothetical protein
VKGRIWLLAIAAGIVLAVYQYVTTRPLQLLDAVATHDVTVAIAPIVPPIPQTAHSGYALPSARITILRTASTQGDLNVVVPAGTVIRNTSQGGQRLITAVPMTLHISSGDRSAAGTVDVYCIDQFGRPPTSSSHLVLAAPLGGDDPLASLAQCLHDKSTPDVAQMAVWLISGNYLDRSYADTRTALITSYETSIREQLSYTIPDGVPPELQQAAPDVSPGVLAAKLAEFRANKLPALIQRTATGRADADLSAMTENAAGALNDCGHDTSHSAFVTTAPQAH